jgi:FkbM family methyltransferase
MLKDKIKNIIPKKFHDKVYSLMVNFFDGHSTKIYSLEGEDMILARIFEGKKNGFYVDVGAHHPKRFSNTYYFYKIGWNGINIDAMPGSMEIFKKDRPRDINIEVAISDENKKLTYYAFSDPALNGFSKDLSENVYQKDYEILFKKEIKTLTLEQILDKFLPEKQKIDFLSIDVESLEFQVIKSNNWNKYMPDVILIEILDNDLESIFENDIYKFLKSKGFKMIAKTLNTVIFKKNHY